MMKFLKQVFINLSSPPLIEWMAPLFNLHPCISEWSVDTEDVDNVLLVFL